MATNLANLERLIKEAVEEQIASMNGGGKLFTDIRSENEKESKNLEKDAKERISVSTPTKNATQINGYRGEDSPSGRNALNLNYDSIDKKYQERVKALVQGKASPNQADIDDEAAGISTKGNKTFYDTMQKDNKQYANIMGTSNINDRIEQPNKNKDPKFATENKVKVGDVFKEAKNNLKLQVTGLNEDKSRVTFIDESGKKYSLAIENFRKAVREDKMIREGVGRLNETAPFIAEKAGGKQGAKQSKKQKPMETAAVSPEEKKDDSKKEVKENKIKRLKFNKTTFLTESHAQSLIPEQYKIPGNKFAMIDREGNEFLMECDKFKQIIILEYKNPIKSQKDFDRMKMLWEYDTKRAVGGASVNESKEQREIQKIIKKELEKNPQKP